MTDALVQIVLLTYPVWALIAFAVGLAHLVEYFFVIHNDKSVLAWGVVFIAWAAAFFGAGLLIAEAVNKAIATNVVLAIWLFAIPIFAIVAGVKCWRLWRVLRKVEGK
jgi:hypothetical protein